MAAVFGAATTLAASHLEVLRGKPDEPLGRNQWEEPLGEPLAGTTEGTTWEEPLGYVFALSDL